MEGVYKLLRDMFDYVPKLTQTQFFMTSYAQVKATMACDIINLIQQKAKSLQPAAASAQILMEMTMIKTLMTTITITTTPPLPPPTTTTPKTTIATTMRTATAKTTTAAPTAKKATLAPTVT